MLLFQADPASFSDVTVLVIVLLVLLLLSGITAGAETACFSLKSKDFNYLKTKERPAARQAVQLLNKPKHLLATLLVSNTFFNLAIVITSGLLVQRILEMNKQMELGLVTIVAEIAVISFLLILFAQVLPKVYAAQNNLKMVLFAAPFLNVLQSIFKPVTGTLVNASAYLEEDFSPRPTANMTEAELETAIAESVGHQPTSTEITIFRGILRFGSVTVRQIMRTRLDVCAVPQTYTFKQVEAHCGEEGYSRFPVYDGSLDKVIGMIHSKDFMPHLGEEHFDWHTLIRPAYYVHEGKYIESLLRDFQERKAHFAVVADEFGGTSGIVTLEDILEEIVGEIRDEHDAPNSTFQRLDAHTFMVEGKMLINDACRQAGLPLDTFDRVRGGSDSVGGLAIEIAGRFLKTGESVSWEGFTFTADETEGARILLVKLECPSGSDKVG
jgi:gliding motility-associated protein GldE